MTGKAECRSVEHKTRYALQVRCRNLDCIRRQGGRESKHDSVCLRFDDLSRRNRHIRRQIIRYPHRCRVVHLLIEYKHARAAAHEPHSRKFRLYVIGICSFHKVCRTGRTAFVVVRRSPISRAVVQIVAVYPLEGEAAVFSGNIVTVPVVGVLSPSYRFAVGILYGYQPSFIGKRRQRLYLSYFSELLESSFVSRTA